MELAVLIEPLATGGYRATSPPPLACSAEGATAEEAFAKLQQLVEGRLAVGAKVVPMTVRSDVHPIAKSAGVFKDNPLFDEWQAAIAEYRRQRDAELDEEP